MTKIAWIRFSGRTQNCTSYQALNLTAYLHSICPPINQTNTSTCTHPLESCYLSAGRVAQFSHCADTDTETKPRIEAQFADESLSRNKQLNCPPMLRRNISALDFLLHLLLLPVMWMNLPEAISVFSRGCTYYISIEITQIWVQTLSLPTLTNLLNFSELNFHCL